MPWRYRHGGRRVGPQELRQPSAKYPPGTQAPPQGSGAQQPPKCPRPHLRGSPLPRRGSGSRVPAGAGQQQSPGMFSAEPTNACLCPPGSGSHGPPAHRPPGPLAPPPGTAPRGRRAAHITLRAPGHASPSAAHSDPAAAQTPRRRAPRNHRPGCLPALLALYSFSHCLPCQNTTRVTCPNNSQPTLVTSSAEAARAGCYGNAAAAKRPRAGVWGPVFPGQGLSRLRDPPGAASTARTEAVLVLLCECTRVTWQMSSQGLQDRKIIIVSPPPQGCWPGAEELGSSPK